MQRGLIFRRVKECLNGFDDFGIEHTPDSDRISIELMPKPVQKPIHRLGFWLKPFESLAINPSQIGVLHTFLTSTIFSVRQAAGDRRFVLCCGGLMWWWDCLISESRLT